MSVALVLILVVIVIIIPFLILDSKTIIPDKIGTVQLFKLLQIEQKSIKIIKTDLIILMNHKGTIIDTYLPINTYSTLCMLYPSSSDISSRNSISL